MAKQIFVVVIKSTKKESKEIIIRYQASTNIGPSFFLRTT